MISAGDLGRVHAPCAGSIPWLIRSTTLVLDTLGSSAFGAKWRPGAPAASWDTNAL